MADNDRDHSGRMLLHACCGPCSLEPARALCQSGADLEIYYSNSNIAPDHEYERRLDALVSYWEEPHDDGVGPLTVIEGERDPDRWRQACGEPFRAGRITREQRCRECYRMRFEDAASYASEHGYASLGTTLSVSPYQYTEIIQEELEAACKAHGLRCAFEDYRPLYDEATRRSREAGMYRQNYCGCSISAAEAEAERAQRREQRRLEREKRNETLADKRAAEEAERLMRRQERQAYDNKKARQRQMLREMRMASKARSAEGSQTEVAEK